jgi:hypothetical protein
MFAMMSARPAFFALIFLGFSLSGCKDKPPPQEASVAPDKPAPTPSDSAVATPAPSASAVEPAPAPRTATGPRFMVRYKARIGDRMFWLGAGIVVCAAGSCNNDASLITEKGEVDTMNPTGVTELHYPRAFKAERSNTIQYMGDYPEICAEYGSYLDRTDFFSVIWKRTGKTWSEGRCPQSPDYEREETIPRPPRDLDDALLHAPIADSSKKIVHGASGPPMLIAEETLYSWDGKIWSKREAPWKKQKTELERFSYPLSKRPVRLANGSTYVPDGGYLIDTKGEISAIQVIDEKDPVPADATVAGIIWANQHPWVVAEANNTTWITSPDESAKSIFMRASIPARTIPAKTPAPTATIAPPSAPASASAASSAAAPPEPALSASAASSAEAPPAPNAPANGLSELKAFTADCPTPFVLLASPRKPGQEYATTRAGLKGHSELQDIVTFVEIVIDGQTFFGAQTKNEADAHQFMEVIEKSIKGMKPSLRCLDALSRIPDRYAPPEGIRIIGINLTTGELIPFD